MNKGTLPKSIMNMLQEGHSSYHWYTLHKILNSIDKMVEDFPIQNIKVQKNSMSYQLPADEGMSMKMVVGWFVKYLLGGVEE